MEKRNFVKLCNLLDISDEMETAEDKARWERNVLDSVGTEGYWLAASDDGDYIVKQFSTDEIEFVTVDCYFIMGSATEQERFYAQDFITVREKATGDLYAYETQEIFEGAF
jgi:hypothetical protein